MSSHGVHQPCVYSHRRCDKRNPIVKVATLLGKTYKYAQATKKTEIRVVKYDSLKVISTLRLFGSALAIRGV